MKTDARRVGWDDLADMNSGAIPSDIRISLVWPEDEIRFAPDYDGSGMLAAVAVAEDIDAPNATITVEFKDETNDPMTTANLLEAIAHEIRRFDGRAEPKGEPHRLVSRSYAPDPVPWWTRDLGITNPDISDRGTND